VQQSQPSAGFTAFLPTSAPNGGPPQVVVSVPSYGGGGPTMVEYNGDYISMDIPKDATPNTTIMVDVPARHLHVAANF